MRSFPPLRPHVIAGICAGENAAPSSPPGFTPLTPIQLLEKERGVARRRRHTICQCYLMTRKLVLMDLRK
uniref:Uncharacterized protein n=1 Tax=Chenopodium quinoa TaxID=63459 RepID=A0A803NDG1_CHEQI